VLGLFQPFASLSVLSEYLYTPFVISQTGHERNISLLTNSEQNIQGNWKVLLHRDEWYTFDYCEGALLMIIPVLTRKKVLPYVF
jgi:hypothetical protein